jgi:hypothetical protein
MAKNLRAIIASEAEQQAHPNQAQLNFRNEIVDPLRFCGWALMGYAEPGRKEKLIAAFEEKVGAGFEYKWLTAHQILDFKSDQEYEHIDNSFCLCRPNH